MSLFHSNRILRYLHVSLISGCRGSTLFHVTPTNPASKDNTAKSINLHPLEILYVANLHVPLSLPAPFSLSLSLSPCNLATHSLSFFPDSWKLGLFGFIRYVLEAETGFAQPFVFSFLFLAKSDFNRSHSNRDSISLSFISLIFESRLGRSVLKSI